jgi:hypothetical protein
VVDIVVIEGEFFSVGRLNEINFIFYGQRGQAILWMGRHKILHNVMQYYEKEL